MRERNERERNRTWRERGNWRERGLEDRDAYGEFPGQFGDDGEGRYGFRDERWPAGRHHGAYGAGSGGRYGSWGGGRYGSWGDPREYGERNRQRGSSGRGWEPERSWEEGSYGRRPSGERQPTRDRWESTEHPEGDYQGPGNYEQRPGYGRGGYGYGHGASGRYDYRPEPWNERVTGPGGYRAESGGERPSGGFRGRGPRGYTRSDERIREEICERLCDEDIDVSDVEVSVAKGEVTLSGTVTDRWIKRDAEGVVEGIPGVRDVNNQIRVKRNTDRWGETPATTTGTKGADRRGQNEERTH